MHYHVNGDLVPAEEATVSVRDRGFLYGDAAFETLRAYGGEVFEWDAHRARLERTCGALGMPDAAPDDLALRIAETLDANDLEDAYVRASVTRGVQPGRLTPAAEVDPSVVIVVAPLPRGGLGGESTWDGPAVVQSVKTRRTAAGALPPDLKTHNYLNGILARLELRRASSDAYRPDEALMRDADGFVAEGATSNLFFVDDGTLRTPAEGAILPGVTRRVVLDLAADEAFPVEVGKYAPDDVRGADEAFLTNTTWEVRPIESVDGIEVGAGPITRLLARLFDEYVEERCYRRESSAPGTDDASDGGDHNP
ncbi:aminotransferase class IV [Halomarina halobia]|uniref:Aminotransferase class IV n=1 Tax=Halomarina halobia TaxID=3033386 RepID=A0ABD6ACG5_9EURY|nr:aminotransferase class IV [Halomarina sp. PSR21]